MQVWAVTYDQSEIPEQLFQSSLLLVDPSAQARIKRYYHREDACRTLIGRLMPRILLKERGVERDAMAFGATDAGKPYITTKGLDPPLAYNVTHDQGVVAMAFGNGHLGPPAYTIGVDVMKVHIPPRTTFLSFVDSVGSQLTAREHDTLLVDVAEDEALRRFFWIWTMKEAYTKALGLGLGFDFCRIEYDAVSDTLTIDGQIPKGWQFVKFQLTHDGALYQGVAARLVGGHGTEISNISQQRLSHYSAACFVKRAIKELK
ncbi:hypothetical protein SERLA73DRAFT_177190 [Serpula lacrymans var. lacrymans S7.3]|uniref:holo-[acyl-carrier-protein] synthase n=2 Tax=Serpula lacrymans var. lacrymans TaxID=341189 RepID=F8PNK7_SERL3|nr:uncharacterized protein SERLADRAFT_460658 [Serpula lacrymans var. lacrymans S7.9]EGO01734.1 hypothetical protein SERLA73DRAFT_177190 [Serpula lacrymans var. lacrymans S7.3]EGO27373.1 hypothetical protein SERLADRAFT_460658 [Serpula lacrymans var. lacrymans S7.9]